MNSSIKRFEVLTGNATDFMKKYEYKASRAETFGEGWGHKISCADKNCDLKFIESASNKNSNMACFHF